MMHNRLKGVKVAIESLGCAKNTVDSEVMAGAVLHSACELTDSPHEADFIIINTCSFILDAKLESVELACEMAALKNEYPEKKLILAGCLAERYPTELRKEIPELDALIGTANYDRITEAMSNIILGMGFQDFTGNLNRVYIPTVDRYLSTPEHYSFLKVSEGCNNACAFCIIPSLKGKYKSLSIEDLVKETRYLAKKGTKELILIAQDTSRYGIDKEKDVNLLNLLKALEEVNGIEWIRLHYMYPDVIEDDLIDYMAQDNKVLPYFDIPLQHISDRVLKRMRRNTSKADIIALIDKIRRAMPEAIIRSTLIAGFPGESEEDFDELMDFISEYKLDRVGVFAYSDEENTHSASLGGKLSEDIKEFRRAELMCLQEEISLQKQRDRIGKVERVIVDGFDGEYYLARSFRDSPDVDGLNYIIPPEDTLLHQGDFLNVRVIESSDYDVYCTPVISSEIK